ncbi:hypothetical protein H4R34_000462 [Dimargaris verticillata]|uniref:Fungal lipase-type domain-containing protein n=1 Tax=Dimargaris verticillata TaxID=2761393 RepID=A0A9W8BD98_9FUNG|nr:hypothetical protein H4R34_000462 [Dimargaris verticillata]
MRLRAYFGVCFALLAWPLVVWAGNFGIANVSRSEVDSLKVYANLAAVSYDYLTAWECARCSHVSNTQLVNFFSSKNNVTVGYVVINSNLNAIALTFRGSKNTRQWLLDLKMLPKRWPKSIQHSRVHRGFLRGYEDVADRLYTQCKCLLARYPSYRLIIIGHSLGGALASLAAVDFLQRNSTLADITSVVTFGKPRVGNKHYVKHYNSLNLDSTRVVNKHDVVPHVPPRLFGFHHEGEEMWILPNSTANCTVYCPGKDDEDNPNGSRGARTTDLKVSFHHWAWDVKI